MTTAGGWEAARSGGAVGWGLVELSKWGATPWGGSFVAPTCPPISWKFSKLTLAPSSQRSPAALQPQPRCPGAAPPAHPLRPGSSGSSRPSRWTPSRHPPLGGPGGPSHPCIPTLPVPSASPALSAPTLPPSLWPDPHLFEEVRAGPEPLPSPSPPLPLGPTLTHTDADQCVHDGSEGLHVLALGHGPTWPVCPRVPDPGRGGEPGA